MVVVVNGYLRFKTGVWSNPSSNDRVSLSSGNLWLSSGQLLPLGISGVTAHSLIPDIIMLCFIQPIKSNLSVNKLQQNTQYTHFTSIFERAEFDGTRN